MRLKDLKQNIKLETDMSSIYEKIKFYAEDGESYVPFYHRGCESEDEISEAQVAILREQGYTVTWERSCLWYEVSGWK